MLYLNHKISIANASVCLRASAFEITSDLYDNVKAFFFTSPMAECLERASQWHKDKNAFIGLMEFVSHLMMTQTKHEM